MLSICQWQHIGNNTSSVKSRFPPKNPHPVGVGAPKTAPGAGAGAPRRMTSNHQQHQKEHSSTEDQHAPSTGQPGVDLRSVRRRIVELVGLMDAEPFTRILDSAECMLREVDSLRQHLAAAQAEREEAIGLSHRYRNDAERLRAQVEELRQRASDYEAAEGTAIAQRNAALNEALKYKYQAEAMRGAVAAYIAWWDEPMSTRPAEDWQRQINNLQAALDAASTGQPATPSNRPHPAPSANDSQRDRHTDTQNQDRADEAVRRHPEAPGE